MTTWTFDVDWNRDRDFADANEALWADVIDLHFAIGHRSGPYQLVAEASELNATLKSYDGKYNPENSASALFGSILPGLLCRVTANGTAMFQGYLADVQTPWQMLGTYTGTTTARLRAHGFTNKLQDNEANFQLQQNKRADEIIERVVTQIGPPAAVGTAVLVVDNADKGLVDTGIVAKVEDFLLADRGVQSFTNYGDVTSPDKQDVDSEGFQGNNALRRLRDLTEADLGRLWPNDRSGKVLWYNRDHFPSATTVAGTADDTGTLGEKPVAVDYRYGAAIVNEVSVSSYERTTPGTVVLWSGNIFVNER